jgi:carbonic anhydrase/acetyltransferase-like protein (isoleucine patch superfamily)
MILEYRGIKPKIGKNVFIAPTAVVIGEVDIMDNASIWYGTVVRGDREPITIGRNTNIQDNCTLHTDPGKPLIIADHVSIGHSVVVHGCTIEEFSLIGIGAVVLSGAVIKTGSIVASGAMVREGQQVGPYHLVAGVPAVLKKALDEKVVDKNMQICKNYVALAGEHLHLKPVT